MPCCKFTCKTCVGDSEYPSLLLINEKTLADRADKFITLEELCYHDEKYLQNFVETVYDDQKGELRLATLLLNYAKENNWLIETASSWIPIHHQTLLSTQFSWSILPPQNKYIIQQIQKFNGVDDANNIFRYTKAGSRSCETMRMSCFHSILNSQSRRYCFTIYANNFFNPPTYYQN